MFKRYLDLITKSRDRGEIDGPQLYDSDAEDDAHDEVPAPKQPRSGSSKAKARPGRTKNSFYGTWDQANPAAPYVRAGHDFVPRIGMIRRSWIREHGPLETQQDFPWWKDLEMDIGQFDTFTQEMLAEIPSDTDSSDDDAQNGPDGPTPVDGGVAAGA